MMENLAALMNIESSLKVIQGYSGRALILGIPIYTLGGDRIRKKDNVYDLSPEINKALSATIIHW